MVKPPIIERAIMHAREYKIEEGRLVERRTGVPVPVDEPLFILRATDKNALPVLLGYHMISNLEQKAAITPTAKDFKDYAKNNPDKMGEPSP